MEEEGGGEEKEQREGSHCEKLSCLSLSISGLGLAMRLPLRIFCYLALEINLFAAESLLIKGAFNLQMGIKNTSPRVTEAWSGSLFGHSFPSYSTAWPPK